MIEQKLKQVFGFDSLRNGQKQVIDNVLSVIRRRPYSQQAQVSRFAINCQR